MIDVEILSNDFIKVSSEVVADSVKYQKVKFSFPEHWNGYLKTAVFSNGDIVKNVILNSDSPLYVSDDIYYIPHEVIKAPGFTISVFGILNDTVLTSDNGVVRVRESGMLEGEVPSKPTPSEYQQLIEVAKNAESIAQSVRDDANAGAFNGKDGKDGINGVDGKNGYTPQKGVDYFTPEDIAGLNIPSVDQTYNPESTNAQSGKAVAEALTTIQMNGLITSMEFQQGSFHQDGTIDTSLLNKRISWNSFYESGNCTMKFYAPPQFKYCYCKFTKKSGNYKWYFNSGWCYGETTIGVLEGELIRVVLARVDNTSIYLTDANNLSVYTTPNKWVINNDNNFKVYSHRLCSWYAPQNTISAMKKAISRGFLFLETDVRLTLDNVPVLCHDDNISTVSNGNVKISQTNYADLLQYDFGSWFDEKFAGEKIATLEDVLKLCVTSNCYLNLELKRSVGWTNDKILIVYNLLKKYRMLKRVIWNDNDVYVDTLQKILAIDNTQNVMMFCNLTDTNIDNCVSLLTGFNEVHICSSYKYLTSEKVANAINSGLLVDTHSISNTEDGITKEKLLNAISMGVGGLLTEFFNTEAEFVF